MDNAMVRERSVLMIERPIRRKRTHKKSRNGCAVCRNRRVKCDETWPNCKHCSERGLVCSYRNAIESTVEGGLGLSQPTNRPVTASSVEVQHPRQVPHALLWQYYLSYASGTLAAANVDGAYAEMWQSSIPAVAHNESGPSHGLMALSALCMSAHQAHIGGGTFDYAATAALHYSRALESLRNSILALQQVDTDVVLACAVVLIPCGMYLSQNPSGPTSEWLHHVRGFRNLGDVVIRLNGSMRSQHKLIPFPQSGTHDRQRYSMIIGDEKFGHRATMLLNSIRDSGHGAINELCTALAESVTSTKQQDTETYSAGIFQVQSVMDFVLEYDQSNYLRGIFSWVLLIPEEFVQMLEGKDELALVIAAHWMVCVMLLDDLWFLRGFGAFRIEVINVLLEKLRSPYLPLLDWPRGLLEEWKSS